MDESIFNAISYIPGVERRKPELLSRYLPPIPDGVISDWLLKNVAPGSWILDPFAACPRLTVEAARAGYKIIVTANNPISRFLLEMAASPPKSDDLSSALAELAASYKTDERIEPHIRSLYNTNCARCGRIISADAFLWEQGNLSPSSKIYTCPFCGDNGEHQCTTFDVDRMRQFSTSGLHKARAMERVISSTDQDRIHVEQALSVYLPRALYALITIINKIEGLNITALQNKYLTALLLHASDQANVMWKVPSTGERRRQLTIPRHFRENNIWVSLEQGIDVISAGGPIEFIAPVPISTWPDLPPEDGGICIYEGRLISIVDSLSKLDIKSVCAAIPRPNQAFWTLSALWAGWLWGREVVGSFKSVLHRQRYDWAWHTTALESIFKQLSTFLEPSTKIFGLIGEAEPGFIASALIAAGFARCDLLGIAIRNGDDQAQIVWRCKSSSGSSQFQPLLNESGTLSAKKYLEIRGEPASYLNTVSAALISIIQSWSSVEDGQTSTGRDTTTPSQAKTPDPTGQPEPSPSFVYSHLYNAARESLSYRAGFLRFNLQDLTSIEPINKSEIVQSTLFTLESGFGSNDEDENSPFNDQAEKEEPPVEKDRPTRSSDVSESILLWLRYTEKVNHRSISDEYELSILNFMSTHPKSSIEDIDKMLCENYQGLYTPDQEFIRICIDSYGENDEINNDLWHLRSEDEPGVRMKDLDKAKQYIIQIGARLNVKTTYRQNDKFPSLLWEDQIGELNYSFFPTITASIGEIVISHLQTHIKTFIVLPGSRANLILYKIQRDPRLSKSFDPSTGNWRFLKFRHLKSLAENPLLNRENLDQLLKLDPLTYTTSQLRMI